jgi:hypothetical protein
MNKLKILILEISNDVDIVTWLSKARDNLRTVEWHGEFSNFMLSNELCIMEWWGYPFESLPTSFQSDNLVELIMPYSCIKQPFDGRKVRFWLYANVFFFFFLLIFFIFCVFYNRVLTN